MIETHNLIGAGACVLILIGLFWLIYMIVNEKKNEEKDKRNI